MTPSALTASSLHLEPGRDEPFGAHARDGGVNFAVWSENAERVELCVFDPEGRIERQRFDLLGPRHDVWSGFLRGAAPGLVYGLRVHGPYDPDHGHRFNPNKLLLDPYAREIVGRFDHGRRAPRRDARSPRAGGCSTRSTTRPPR